MRHQSIILLAFVVTLGLAPAPLPASESLTAEDALAAHDLREALAAVEAGYSSPWPLNFADFTPRTPTDRCLFAGAPGGAAYVSAFELGNVCCIVAPVHLPDGATVTSMFFYLYDDSGDDLSMSLRRKRINNTVASSVLATVATAGTSTSVRILPDITITDPVIDNTQYSYFVTTDECLGSPPDLRVYQALIFYSE